MKKKNTLIIVCIVIVVLALVAWLWRAGRPQNQETPATPVSVTEVLTAVPDTESVAIARQMVEDQFAEFGEGFTLQELTYNEAMSSDPEELAYVNSLERGTFDEVVIFNSLFHTPASFEEITAWEPDTDYTWTWYVAHNVDNGWELVTYGY